MEKNDPDVFALCNTPHASMDEAEKQLDEFSKAVYELRKKHKIANVLIVVKDNCIGEGGLEGKFYTKMEMGNGMEHENMAAWALGSLTKERAEMIARFVAGKV